MFMIYAKLWFDVGIKRYTTHGCTLLVGRWLWFDVGIKRYTTNSLQVTSLYRCGLM